MTQRNKGNHKDSFLIIVPKHICPGTVGANWPSLITTQARGAGLTGPTVPPGPGPAVLLWPHSLPRAFICTPAPPLPLGFQANPASGFSLLLSPFVFVYFHEEPVVFITPLLFSLCSQLFSSPV